MTNIDKIINTIHSCKTLDQIKSCKSWIMDLHDKKILNNQEKFITCVECVKKMQLLMKNE